MRSFVAMFVDAMALTMAAAAQPARSAEQELLALSAELMDAVAQRDRATLERLVADEFTLETPGEPRGSVGKAEWIGNAVRLKWDDFELHHPRVRRLGDVAVVTGRLDFTVTTAWGIPISTDSQVIDVWTRRAGSWQITARHLGATSLVTTINLVAGVVAGVVLCLVVSFLVRLARRRRAKR